MLESCPQSSALHESDIVSVAAAAVTLQHAAEVLVPGGFLCMYESNNALQPLLWGLSEQGWQFTDERDTCMLAGIPRWEQLLGAAGFQKVRRCFQNGRASKAGALSNMQHNICLHGLQADAAAQSNWSVSACVVFP